MFLCRPCLYLGHDKVGNSGEGSKRRSLNANIDLKHEIIKIVENGSGNGLHFANHHEAMSFND